MKNLSLFFTVRVFWIRSTLYSKAVGSREIETTNGSRLQVDSVFYIASLRKAITSLACMIAVEKGLVTLDENVRDIVPELWKIECLVEFEESDNLPKNQSWRKWPTQYR